MEPAQTARYADYVNLAQPGNARSEPVNRKQALRDARATYEQMRRDLATDDITPELYLYAVLHDYLLHDEMKAVVAEMLRKRPGNEDVRPLADWVAKRAPR